MTIRALADSGVAVLYSTHYMGESERMCDRALLIDGGRLVAEGTVAQLIELGGRHPRMEITFAKPPLPCTASIISVCRDKHFCRLSPS
jgi:ABC-type multidrug transport system ATPase subunit